MRLTFVPAPVYQDPARQGFWGTPCLSSGFHPSTDQIRLASIHYMIINDNDNDNDNDDTNKDNNIMIIIIIISIIC